MIIISHRGNVNGPNPKLENNPDYVLNALSLGFDVELDCWVVDSKIFLGHDKPQYLISHDFLNQVKNKIWIHCKNLEALAYFIKTDFNYFWHQSDKYTLTSKRIIWTYPGEKYINNSVLVDLELNSNNNNLYAICTDFPEKALTIFN